MRATPAPSARRGPPAQRDHGPDHQADGLRGDHESPCRSAEGPVGDDRAEDRGRADERGVDGGELRHDDPHPAPARELPPPLAEVGEDGGARARADRPRQPHTGVEDRGQGEARGVDRQPPPGTHQCDERGPARGADDAPGVQAQAEQGVGRAELADRHRLGDEGGRGGQAHRRDGAVEHAEHDQGRDGRRPRDHRHGDRGLSGCCRERGADEDHGAGEPVGEDAAEQQDGDVGEGARGDDESEVRRRARQVQHGEGQGDRSDGVAEDSGRAGGEEPAEGAVRERPVRQRPAPVAGHGRRSGNMAVVIDTGAVPGVLGGRAAACSSADASPTCRTTRRQTSGSTQSSASVES